MSTFLLVHGAWFGGWCYQRVAAKLWAQGQVVYAPTLTGIGERSHLFNPDLDLETHVTDILNVIKWEELDDFVLVGHSYGGMVTTVVADRVPGKIRRLVYLDAFVPEDGKRELDYLPDELVAGLRADAAEQNNGMRPIPPEAFHLNEEDIPRAKRLCTLQPLHTFDQPVKLSGGLAKLREKRVFIWNEGFAEGPFKQFYDVFVSNNDWATYKLPCGHATMLDMPDELVRILLEVA
jgi:pimeloyl-ACP methyl ester carboxylesterase